MAQIKKHYPNGFVSIDVLAKIVSDMADDIAELKKAINEHQHTENTAGTYAQNATVSKSTYVTPLKTSKEA